MSLQLFVWIGQGQAKDNRVYYHSFTLNEQTYHVGDCVYLYPEDETYPPYVGCILAAFVDLEIPPGADPHCIEVKWFERRVNLEPSTKGIEESEREVFELEDTDVNPIGCISGKCRIIKAYTFDQARSQCGNRAGWFFCRGYFQQHTNSFVAYTPAEMAAQFGPPPEAALPPLAAAADGAGGGAGHLGFAAPPARHAAGLAGSGQGLSPHAGRGALAAAGYANGDGVDAAGGGAVALQGDEEPGAQAAPPRRHGAAAAQGGQRERGDAAAAREREREAAAGPASKRQKATGRVCMECGATTTPQWREGPMGPKTLCNACGVRYVRSQQKAAGHKRGSGGQKNGQGRSQEKTPPRAQQTERARRGTNPKGSPSARPTSGQEVVPEALAWTCAGEASPGGQPRSSLQAEQPAAGPVLPEE